MLTALIHKHVKLLQKKKKKEPETIKGQVKNWAKYVLHRQYLKEEDP